MNAEPIPVGPEKHAYVNQSPLTTRLESLRDDWAMQAHMLERIYGANHPPARTLRLCVSDLARAMNPDADSIA